VKKSEQTFTTNLGIIRSQLKRADYSGVDFRGYIDEMGDMDRQFGYEEVNADSLQFTQGKVKTMRQKEWESLTTEDEMALIRQGFLFVKWTDGPSPVGPIASRRLNLINNIDDVTKTPRPGQSANFLLMRDSTLVYAVVNGFLVDAGKEAKPYPNSIGF